MARRNTRRVEIEAQAGRMESDLRAIRRAMHKPLEAETARGELTAPQIAVMRIVVRQHGIPLRDLSREVSLAHSTVSGIVDRLEKRGMLSRRADAADGRITRIYPTAEVTQFVREAIPVLARRPLEAALVRMTENERAELEKSVRRLREALECPEGSQEL